MEHALLAQCLGWTATTMFTLMVVPQLAKTIKMKNVEGVSISLYVIYSLANCVALCYAILIHQPPLVIKYVLALITAIIYIAVYLKFRKPK